MAPAEAMLRAAELELSAVGEEEEEEEEESAFLFPAVAEAAMVEEELAAPVAREEESPVEEAEEPPVEEAEEPDEAVPEEVAVEEEPPEEELELLEPAPAAASRLLSRGATLTAMFFPFRQFPPFLTS